MIKLDDAFRQTLAVQDNLFEVMMSLPGEIVREMPGRATLRLQHAGNWYFIKRHFGVGWREIIKNLVALRWPVISAENEWCAIMRLDQLRIQTMTLVGYGYQGNNPATRRSFVLTAELENTESLEDFCGRWLTEPYQQMVCHKRKIILRVAAMTRSLHENGINHRDLYLCHFLLDLPSITRDNGEHELRLSLIDLHRVQMRRSTPLRWIIKDLAALYFSSMDIGLTVRDVYRFLRAYRQCSLHNTLSKDLSLWRRVTKRAIRHYLVYHRKEPQLPKKNGLLVDARL